MNVRRKNRHIVITKKGIKILNYETIVIDVSTVRALLREGIMVSGYPSSLSRRTYS